MNQPSGFVSIRFRLTAGILLTLGIAGVVAWSLGAVTDWFPAPYLLAALSAVLILAGIYIFAAIPAEERQDS
jgi:hypothetical protein